MRTIFKYPLELTDSQTIQLPEGAAILRVEVQAGTLQLWAMVDTDKPKQNISITIRGTGHPLPDGFNDPFLGTVFLQSLVFHVFGRWM